MTDTDRTILEVVEFEGTKQFKALQGDMFRLSIGGKPRGAVGEKITYSRSYQLVRPDAIGLPDFYLGVRRRSVTLHCAVHIHQKRDNLVAELEYGSNIRLDSLSRMSRALRIEPDVIERVSAATFPKIAAMFSSLDDTLSILANEFEIGDHITIFEI